MPLEGRARFRSSPSVSLNLIFKPLYKEERSWVVDIVERTRALESQIGSHGNFLSPCIPRLKVKVQWSQPSGVIVGTEWVNAHQGMQGPPLSSSVGGDGGVART